MSTAPSSLAEQIPARPTRLLAIGEEARPAHPHPHPRDAAVSTATSPPAETASAAYARGVVDGAERLRKQFAAESAAERERLLQREKQLAESEVRLQETLAVVRDWRAAHEQNLEATLSRLVLLACTTLLAGSIAQGTLVPAVLRSLLARHGGSGMTTLRVHPSMLARPGARDELQAVAGVAVIADANLAPGSVRLQDDHQRIDADITRQYRALCDALQLPGYGNPPGDAP